MPDAPSDWNPFGDDSAQPGSSPAEPAPAYLPPPPPSGGGHRGQTSFPWLPVSFAAGGLALGVVATLLITQLSGGSSKPATVAAAGPTSSSVTAPRSTSAVASPTKSASKKASPSATSSAPVVLPPADEAGLAHAAPLSVVIPKIGVSSSLVSLGLESDGTLQVPSDYNVAGWYANGAFPGDADQPPALIVGHVDDTKGPAVFFRLKELSVGDKVIVPRADGTTATFVIYQTDNYLKSAFPANSVYAPTKRPELRLITCTGTFDHSAKSYLSNFVAYAYLVGGTS